MPNCGCFQTLGQAFPLAASVCSRCSFYGSLHGSCCPERPRFIVWGSFFPILCFPAATGVWVSSPSQTCDVVHRACPFRRTRPSRRQAHTRCRARSTHRARRREDSTEDHLKGRNGCAAYPQSGRVIGAFFVDERLVGLAPQLRIEDCLLAPVVDCLGPPQHPAEGGNVDDGEAEVDDVPAPPSADCVVQRTAPAPQPRRGRRTRRAGATGCNRG